MSKCISRGDWRLLVLDSRLYYQAQCHRTEVTGRADEVKGLGRILLY